MPQGVLARDGGIALLSLGNFLFRPDYGMPDEAHRSIIAEVALYKDRIDVTLVPLRLDEDGIPAPAAPADAAEILEDLAATSRNYGTVLDIRAGPGHASASLR